MKAAAKTEINAQSLFADMNGSRCGCGDLLLELDQAEEKAWDALSRYKFQMFGYWAAIWVHLNRISQAQRPNPWSGLVRMARIKRI